MLAKFKLPDSSTIDILVEWRSIDTTWSANILDTMRRRFNNISQLLRDSHLQSKEYLILESVGFVEEPGSSAVGFLSRLPRAVTTESNVKSLHDLLNSPAGRPDLDWRIQLALELAVSLYQMHSTVWVHKNIRSRSVIFFSQTKLREGLREDLHGPFLCGFGMSRPDDISEQTEKRPEDLPGSSFDLYLPWVYTGATRLIISFNSSR